MQMTPYLNFTGQCREAFDVYAEVLNGRIVERFTYGESPMCDEMAPESHDHIMHTLLVADGAGMVVDRFGTAWIINGNLQEDTGDEGAQP